VDLSSPVLSCSTGRRYLDALLQRPRSGAPRPLLRRVVANPSVRLPRRQLAAQADRVRVAVSALAMCLAMPRAQGEQVSKARRLSSAACRLPRCRINHAVLAEADRHCATSWRNSLLRAPPRAHCARAVPCSASRRRVRPRRFRAIFAGPHLRIARQNLVHVVDRGK